MTKFTKEHLQQIAETDHVQCGDAAVMARLLLSGMEQEPVAQAYQPANIGVCAPLGPSVMMLKPLSPGTKLYAAPQLTQPAMVSDEMINTFEAEFRRAFKVNDGVEQLIEIDYQGEKFSLSIRDAATWWKLGRATILKHSAPFIVTSDPCMMEMPKDADIDTITPMLQGAEPVTDNTNQQFESLGCVGSRLHVSGLIVTSDKREMCTPACCSKHPETELQVHPFEQLMSYPPQPVMYCPLCRPEIADWVEEDKQLRQSKELK